jgi:hypothetical protein
MEVVMAMSKVVEISASAVASRRIALIAASAFLLATVQAQAQQAQIAQDGRVIVTGEGDVAVAPDHAQITGGVTTRAKSVKEATDANSKAMAAVTAALLEAGIEQKDIQTLRFSIQPVYAPQGPNTEPKLSGYSVSNQVRVKIRQIGKIGEILDRLVASARPGSRGCHRRCAPEGRGLRACLGPSAWTGEVDYRGHWRWSSRSDAGAGRFGLDGSARADRDWRRHVKSEDHRRLRNCSLMV